MRTFITQLKKVLFALAALIMVGIGQSWTTSESTENSTANSSVMAMEVVGAWNRLTSAQRTTLQNGGAVNFFDLGLCNAMGDPITVNISSDPAPLAANSGAINARPPRRWGNTSFYLGRETANAAGVQYCFEFSEPTPFSIDTRDHAYFANEEAVTVSARNAGTPVDLQANFFGSPAYPGNGMSGNGTPEVTLNAFSTEGGGLWWEVNSAGANITDFCIQYYSTASFATVEPFNLYIEGDKCVPDDAVLCGGADWISRWNRLNTSQRTDLREGNPVFGFQTGFCDESGDKISFLEITPSGSFRSGNPGKNGKEPRPYGLYSFDNGREYAGMGGNQYCFTMDEARPIRLSSQEHAFFQSGEVIHLSAFLGTEPVILEGIGPQGPVLGTSAGLTLEGIGYGLNAFWNINSDNRPVSQVCVEYYVEGGAPLSREPFALGICAPRCLIDDPYACSLTSGPCSFPKLDIQKTVTPLNGFGLDLCNNPGSGLPQFEVTIIMSNQAGSLKQLWLEEDLMKYFGPAYDHLLTQPEITFSTATGTPHLNPNFNGITDTDLFVVGTGGLYAGQEIHISFTVELNPNAPGAQSDLVNSVYGGGESNGGSAYNDNSGSSSGGPGAPTAFQNLPAGYSATPAEDLTLEATIPNYMNGINPWLDDNGGAEFHVPGCGPTTWTNDYDPANWVEGCGQITGSVLVTFTGTNNCGYQLITCATFTLEDTEGPNCTKPEDLVLDCNDPNANQILQDWLDYDGNFTDLSTPVTFTNDFAGLDSVGCNGDPVLVTWTATDACGNSTFFDATLTVVDNTGPAFSNVPGDLTLDRCDSIPPPDSITVTDGCDLDPEVVFTETQTGDDCDFTITRTWTATDDCGNSTMYVQTINVADNNPPVFTNVPADVTMECPDVPAVQDPTVTDCSSFTVVFDETQIGGACPVPNQLIRRWIATDTCGNVDSVIQVVTMISPMNNGEIIFDPSDPSDITADCADNPDFDDVQATTTCPQGGLDVTFTDVVNNNGDCSQPFSVTRTWIAHDACGNLDSVSQTIFIGPDTEAPMFHTMNPTDIMVDCGDDPVLPIAFDNCGPTALSYEDTNVSGSCDSGFVFTRTWTATDLCGNSSTFAQNVTTSPDNSPPIFTFTPFDQFFDCEDSIVFEIPEIVDNCSDVTLTFQDSLIGTGDCNEVNGVIYGYDIIRIWIATDACGNVAMDTVSAWVIPGFNSGNRIAFTQVPEDQSLDCDGNIDFGEAVCRSVCGEVTLTYEDLYEEDCATGSTITRVWTGRDTCGNVVSATQYIHVAPDLEGPVFMDVPDDAMFDCNNGTPVFGQPTVMDNCGAGVVIDISYEDVWENGGDCNSFKVTRTWTAVDPCGNESAASQTLTLMDDDAPVFSTTPADKIIGCGDPIVFDQLEATDDCSSITLIFSDASADLCAGSYTVTRTWVAEDVCGNSTSISQTVTVEDNEVPVFDHVPFDKTISCGQPIVFDQMEATDGCSFAELTFTDESVPTCGGAMAITRTWTATDGCGNTTQTHQKITVEDNQPPVFETIVDDFYIECGEQPVFTDVLAADACSNVTISHTDVEEVLSCEIIHTRIWIATDECGNTAQLSQSIHIVDNDSPVFDPLPSNLEMTQAEYATWTPPVATATDCGQVSIENDLITTTDCDFVTHTYSYLAMDACGNAAAHTLEVLITDAAFDMSVNTPDSLDCGESYNLTLDTENGQAPFAYSWQIVSGNEWAVDAMPGEPMATVTAGEGPAVLSVSTMDANGCVVSEELILDCVAGVNAVTFAEINAFELKPNPVRETFMVSFNAEIAGRAQIRIINGIGSEVTSFTRDVINGDNQYEFDAVSLPAGTYLLLLQMDDKVAVEKFVKIR
ncbi:MAG: T9SS type A sorting domain-containing protein [Bacteroidota bacterium]